MYKSIILKNTTLKLKQILINALYVYTLSSVMYTRLNSQSPFCYIPQTKSIKIDPFVFPKDFKMKKGKISI